MWCQTRRNHQHGTTDLDKVTRHEEDTRQLKAHVGKADTAASNIEAVGRADSEITRTMVAAVAEAEEEAVVRTVVRVVEGAEEMGVGTEADMETQLRPTGDLIPLLAFWQTSS